MSTDLHRRRGGYRITVWRDLDTGNVHLQRPAAVDPADAAAALRRAAEIIEGNALSTDTCVLHPDTPLTYAGSCSMCAAVLRR